MKSLFYKMGAIIFTRFQAGEMNPEISRYVLSTYYVSCASHGHRVPRNVLKRKGPSWAFENIEKLNSVENVIFWIFQPMNCVFVEENGRAEWNMTELVACEERVCNLTADMNMKADLRIFDKRETIWESSLNISRPMSAAYETKVDYKCSDGHNIQSSCSEFYYTPIWDRRCDGNYILLILNLRDNLLSH